MKNKTYANLGGWEAPQGNAAVPSEPSVPAQLACCAPRLPPDGSAAAPMPKMTIVKTELKQDDKAVYATVTVRDQDGLEYRFVGGCFYIFLQQLPPNAPDERSGGQ